MLLAHADEPRAVHAEGDFAVPEHLAGVLLVQHQLAALLGGDEVVPPLGGPDVGLRVTVQMVCGVRRGFAVSKIQAIGDGTGDQTVPLADGEGVGAVYDAHCHAVALGELAAGLQEVVLCLDALGVDALFLQHGFAIEHGGSAPGVVGHAQRFTVIYTGLLAGELALQPRCVEAIGEVQESAALPQRLVGGQVLRIDLHDVGLVVSQDLCGQVVPVVGIAGAGDLDLHIGVNLVVLLHQPVDYGTVGGLNIEEGGHRQLDGLRGGGGVGGLGSGGGGSAATGAAAAGGQGERQGRCKRECDQSFRQFHFSTSLKFNRVGSFLWVCVCVIFRSATLHFFSIQCLNVAYR